MEETRLFDNVARILGSPMPRRQALWRIVQSVAGAALASTMLPGTTRASGSPSAVCPPLTITCGPLCCSLNFQCCQSGNNFVCCGPGTFCIDGVCQSTTSPASP
jgi:hypothetical protein